jgi:hypothetical protein
MLRGTAVNVTSSADLLEFAARSVRSLLIPGETGLLWERRLAATGLVWERRLAATTSKPPGDKNWN